MRWACILLPHLALDGVRRGCASVGGAGMFATGIDGDADAGSDASLPLVLVSGPAQRRVLHAVDPAARALGLRPGMPLAAAQALTQAFAAMEYEPEAEARWLRFLAAWAYRFSSQVSLCGRQALVLEVQGSHGLFGPWPVFEARLREELGLLGFRHRIVAAPHPAAARALANAHDGLAVAGEAALRQALGQLPVERAGFAADTAQAFARMGLRRLRQVLALPRESVARRFPPEVLSHLDALLGQRTPVMESYRPPDRFDARIELGYDVESSQALLFPLRRLTSDLAAFLAGRDGGVQRFALRLEHEGRAGTEVTVGLLSPEREPALLFELAGNRLERAAVPAPVRALRLCADELPPFVPAHRELFDPRPQQAMPWERLRERLRARLGERAVHGLRTHEDHRPERAWRGESANGRLGDGQAAPRRQASGPAGSAAQLPAMAFTRPGWLLATPIVLRGVARTLSGPERIETGWWDGGDVRRDYYVVETRAGQHAWAFRPVGCGGSVGSAESIRPAERDFMLHGWFA